MTLNEYLDTLREPIPQWLMEYEHATPFPVASFFDSRIVFYPGSGTDGQPVKLFGGSHSAHCFVYVDYGVEKAELEHQLKDPIHGFRGYTTRVRQALSERDLVPDGWRPHAALREAGSANSTLSAPFGFLEILERSADLTDDHGAERLALLFLGADGIASYDALFCQRRQERPPFALVIEDHGFGGNYDRFGKNGLLFEIAEQCHVLPSLLLVAENTEPWKGYARLEGVQHAQGGTHNTPRSLFRRKKHP